MALLDPSRSLFIVIGASRFPKAPALSSGTPFSRSADKVLGYIVAKNGLDIDKENILDLFDDSRSAAEQLEHIGEFLFERQYKVATSNAPQNLFVYYVGHGLFTPNDRRYCLAVRSMNANNVGLSAMRGRDLSEVISNNAIHLRRFLIFDCCFAGSMLGEFLSAPGEAANVQMMQDLPLKGTTLLCASSSQDVALAPQELELTMFSDAFLTALKRGNPTLGERMSMRELKDTINGLLKHGYPSNWVRPELHSPDMRLGDIAILPLFPNPAWAAEVHTVIRPYPGEKESTKENVSEAEVNRRGIEEAEQKRVEQEAAERVQREAAEAASQRRMTEKAEQERIEQIAAESAYREAARLKQKAAQGALKEAGKPALLESLSQKSPVMKIAGASLFGLMVITLIFYVGLSLSDRKGNTNKATEVQTENQLPTVSSPATEGQAELPTSASTALRALSPGSSITPRQAKPNQKVVPKIRNMTASQSLPRNSAAGTHEKNKASPGYSTGEAGFYEAARAQAQTKCSAGDAVGCRNLGFIYQYGNGVPQDFVLAEILYKRACDSNEAIGCRFVGDLRIDQLRQPEAIPYYQKACHMGDSPACIALDNLKQPR